MPMHTQDTMHKRSSTSRLDLNQLAKAIVDQATYDEPTKPELPEKNQAAVALGRLGGLKGGAAREKKTDRRRAVRDCEEGGGRQVERKIRCCAYEASANKPAEAGFLLACCLCLLFVLCYNSQIEAEVDYCGRNHPRANFKTSSRRGICYTSVAQRKT